MELPTGYYLERDPEILILRRLDGAMVGAFSARGAAPEAVLDAVEQTAQEKTAYPEQTPAPPEEEPAPGAYRPHLRTRFFGHFEMRCDEELITLGRSGKALSILKYLLANRSRPVSQDHMMGWLWPESNLKRARWSLNSAIHTLRKLIAECPSSAPLNYILLEEGYYRLCSEVRVITDVDQFDCHYEEGRRLQKEGRAEEAAAEYERAIDLYRGEYLEEDLYEDWTMVERERLSNAYMDMLGRLAEHYMQADQPHEAIRACYRILEKDRCHEESHRLLMRCYARLGLWERAQRQYHLCERILSQEYGMALSPGTQALYESLLGDEKD